MFTGLVEAIGRVVAEGGRQAGTVLSVERPPLFTDVRPADSVAVSGVCLTVVKAGDQGRLEFDVSPETLRRSTLGRLHVGDRVNLEVDVLGKYVERLLAARLEDTREGAEARDERLRSLLTNGA